MDKDISADEGSLAHTHDHGHDQHHSKLHVAGYRLSLIFGRGKAAKRVADVARLTPADRVVDVGCGLGDRSPRPPHAAPERATGVDPDPVLLRWGRWLASLLRRRNVSFVVGGAEALPLPDAGVTVVWALSSVPPLGRPRAGLGEAKRVLVPGGRVFLVERLSRPAPAATRAMA